ncbi:putative signal transduction protein [Burkholderiales bacterium JOSHI_001]|nr:putative signal transduction protein [Burkholderiales bacterium JOSHI_001]
MPATADLATPACTPLTESELVIAARSLGAAGTGGARLVAALMDPRLHGAALAKRIGSEPGIAARVMRVANSAYFGCTGTVATLERAIQVLGVQGIKGAAAAACMDRMVAGQAAGAGFDAERFRRHCLVTACLGTRLARELAPDQSEELFMAGLLHDLGIVVQWRLRPKGMQALTQSLAAGQVPKDSLAHAEAHHAGATHEHCTAVVLRSWNLPDSLVQGVARHESAALGPRPDLPSLLRCADSLAAHLGMGLAQEDSEAWPWRQALADWGLDDARLQPLQQVALGDAQAMMAALPD